MDESARSIFVNPNYKISTFTTCKSHKFYSLFWGNTCKSPMPSLMITLLAAVPILYWALNHHKKTKITLYVHDYLTGDDSSAVTVAGRNGHATSILEFGTLLAVDDPVTEGPDIESKEIGRAQGMYINSQLDGKALHLMFSIIFTEGEYRGSSLEIQGSDIFAMKEREFSVVSGTGYFRFIKGYGILTTEMMDIKNLRAVLKLDITVKHF